MHTPAVSKYIGELKRTVNMGYFRRLEGILRAVISTLLVVNGINGSSRSRCRLTRHRQTDDIQYPSPEFVRTISLSLLLLLLRDSAPFWLQQVFQFNPIQSVRHALPSGQTESINEGNPGPRFSKLLTDSFRISAMFSSSQSDRIS